MARQTTSTAGQGGSRRGGAKSKGSKALAAGTAAEAPEAEAAPTKRKTSIPEFVRQVRQETAKVTWPTRKETTITTIMVFIMVILASIFFFVVDQTLSFVMRLLLSLGG